MDRNPLEQEIFDLRRIGLGKADSGDYPELLVVLKDGGIKEPARDFAGAVATMLRTTAKQFPNNPNSRLLLELFCVHESTRALSPAAALNVTVQRVRGTKTSADKDAFRKNEVAKAIQFLAEVLKDEHRPPVGDDSEGPIELPQPLLAGVVDAGLTRFYPSRGHYRLLRDGRESISDYISLATTCVEMVSLNLTTGNETENVVDTFEDLIQRRNPTKVIVSLLDPEIPALAEAIAPVVGSAAETMRGRVRDTLAALAEFRSARLGRTRRQYFEVWCHNCIPNASAIIIDGDSNKGYIQLETKGYKTGMKSSFGFEVGAGTEFFEMLRDSYRHLISDGRRIV